MTNNQSLRLAITVSPCMVIPTFVDTSLIPIISNCEWDPPYTMTLIRLTHGGYPYTRDLFYHPYFVMSLRDSMGLAVSPRIANLESNYLEQGTGIANSHICFSRTYLGTTFFRVSLCNTNN